MKKIPTLFERIFDDHQIKGISNRITPGMEEVLITGVPTVKFDGTCCAVIQGELYRRYDAKKGKNPPEGAIPCCDPDQVTGHWPHWVKVTDEQPDNKWHIQAWQRSLMSKQCMADGTYELVGPHFRNNPYGLETDCFIKHGAFVINNLPRSFEGIRDFLEHEPIEGIVFWLDDEPICKIKRSDFGFIWPVDGANSYADQYAKS